MTNDLSENDLLKKIGIDLVEQDMLIAPPSKDELIERGKKWFDKNYSKFEKAICSSDRIKTIFISSENDSHTILVAISDLISSICVGVSPFTVSQLLIKKGLRMICRDYWKC